MWKGQKFLSLKLRFYQLCYHPKLRLLLKLLFLGALAGISTEVLADDGTDLLAGTDKSAIATFLGTGKIYFLIGEAVLGIVAYMKSKQIIYLAGVIVVMIFTEIVSKLIGSSP